MQKQLTCMKTYVTRPLLPGLPYATIWTLKSFHWTENIYCIALSSRGQHRPSSIAENHRSSMLVMAEVIGLISSILSISQVVADGMGIIIELYKAPVEIDTLQVSGGFWRLCFFNWSKLGRNKFRSSVKSFRLLRRQLRAPPKTHYMTPYQEQEKLSRNYVHWSRWSWSDRETAPPMLAAGLG